MNLFSTFTKRITILLVVFASVLSAAAAEYTFASLAEMHAATNLVDDDIVKITGDVVFEYSYQYYFVVSDKNGTASCMNNYCYNIGQIIQDQSLKAGDVLKNYCGKIVVNSSGVYRLEPTVATVEGSKTFGDGIVIEPATGNYTVKTTKVTVKDLLDNSALYDGKIVSLDLATTKTVGFNTYLIQGNDTLKGFTISELNDDAYPSELIIDRALFRVGPYSNSLSMSQQDFKVTFKSIKSFKATDLAENIAIDLTVQVLKKESYEGKTYLTVYETTGNKLIDCAGLRILLNTENNEDKKIKVGDVINIKTTTAQYKKWVDTGVYFTHSLVTLDAHETSIIENRPITYYVIYPDDIASLVYFEFLPVTIAAELTFTGGENKTHKEKNFAQAQLFVGEEGTVKIYVDIAKKPATVTDKFYLNGILEMPLWQAKSMNSYVIPFSEKDFFSNLKDFSSIAAVIKEGTPINPVIRYRINSDMTIVGIDSIDAVGEEDRKQNVIFVKDNTASLMLLGRIADEFKVGDVITAVEGDYRSLRKSSITSAGARNFGVANCLALDSIAILKRGTNVTPVVPKKVTISELFNNDDLASQVVSISDFTYKVVTEVVQTVTVERHYIYQGEDSIIVDASFADVENASSIIAIYYLNDFYSRLLPYAGEVSEGSEEVGVDNNLAIDNVVFVVNNMIYAQGAEIEVYDVMGRKLAVGVNSANVENANQMVFVVRTKYSNGQVFITKVANY